MKHFKIISIALVICMLASLISCFLVSAEASDDYCLADLRFTQANGTLTLDGAHVVAETLDGGITIELDATEATVSMSATNSINVLDTSKHPYFAFDFAGEVKIGSMVAHYTRKDKGDGNFADLYLNSMLEMADYQVGTVYKDATSITSTRAYGVWDWGKYLCPDPSNPPAAKVFDDGIHRFNDVSCTLSGEVGKRITFYKFGVYCTTDNAILQLGASRGEADMLLFKVSHVNKYSYGVYESIILTGDGKTVKEQCGYALEWWNVFQIENVDGEYTVTKVYKADDGSSKGDVTIPAGGFMLCVYKDCDANKFGNDLVGYRFYDLEGILEETVMQIDTTSSPAMNIYARAPEPVLDPDDYTIHPSVNTSITTNAKTIVTDPSTVANYNPNWSGRVLLAPTETPGIYTVVETQKPNGSAPTFTETIGEGYIILLLHGETGQPDGTIRDSWLALKPGTEIVISGYNFEAGLVNEDAYATIYTDQVPVIPQPSEEPSDEPSTDPSEDSSSTPSDDQPNVPDTGDNGIVAIVILAVVALLGSAVIIKVRH